MLGGNRKLLNPFFDNRSIHDFVLEHRPDKPPILVPPCGQFRSREIMRFKGIANLQIGIFILDLDRTAFPTRRKVAVSGPTP